MTSSARAFLTLALLLFAAAACRQYLPSGRYLQKRQVASRSSTADARGKFDHARHERVFTKQDVGCLDCHRFDLQIESSNEDLARHLSARALYPGAAACHSCHRSGPLRVANAPQTCDTCHDNLAPLRPADHDIAWAKVHASTATADPTACHTCHRQAFCIDCHQRRDTIQTRVHERNFRFYHSVQARANPMQCGSCHRQDFCTRCHEVANVPGNLP